VHPNGGALSDEREDHGPQQVGSTSANGPPLPETVQPAPEVAAVIPVAAFRAGLRVFLRKSERIARAHGLTPQRYLLLLMIKGAPDGSEQTTITELSDRLQLSQSTVSELVDRAEHVGLISRERSAADARFVHLRLSEEGEQRLARSFRSHAQEREALRRLFLELDLEARDSSAETSYSAPRLGESG
jgi:DNA-binding MarR family transcriptional regulator